MGKTMTGLNITVFQRRRVIWCVHNKLSENSAAENFEGMPHIATTLNTNEREVISLTGLRDR
jgi:hypothetical protein